MRLIPLKGKYGDGEFLKVSDEDFDFVSSLKLHVSDKGYVKTYYKGKHRPLHQLIAGKGYDHANGEKFDCTRENLRPATIQQNNANVAARSKCGYKGVHHNPTSKRNPWQAQISICGKMYSLGYHKTKRFAARTYDFYARLIHGEYARLNFPNAWKAD